VKKVEFTRNAQLDLDEIWIYIARDSERQADRVVERIMQAIDLLAERPGLGHVKLDYAPEELRFWTVFSYYIIYRPDTDPMEITRILHSARNIRSILRRS
jgi:plasmid stabilization system protein ParE